MSENVTLDGVVQDPAGDEGFRVGGWVGLIKDHPGAGKLALDDALGAEAFLLSRRSYEWFAARCPPGAALRQAEQPAQVRRVLKPRRGRLEQLDGAKGRSSERGLEAEAGAKRGNSRPRQLPTRMHADGARPR